MLSMVMARERAYDPVGEEKLWRLSLELAGCRRDDDIVPNGRVRWAADESRNRTS